jgi:hypothetical protein
MHEGADALHFGQYGMHESRFVMRDGLFVMHLLCRFKGVNPLRAYIPFFGKDGGRGMTDESIALRFPFWLLPFAA